MPSFLQRGDRGRHGRRMRHDFGITEVQAAEYRVVSASDEGLEAESDDGHSIALAWPGPFPFEIEAEQTMAFSLEGPWLRMTFPSGELAFTLDEEGHFFEGGPLLDDAGHIEVEGGCSLDEENRAVGVRLRSGTEEADFYSGDEAVLGGWTYRSIFAVEVGELVCVEGEHVWQQPDDAMRLVRLIGHRAL